MTLSTELDFYSDWLAFLTGELSARGVELAGSDLEIDLLYFELRRRWVSARPREVFRARSFRCPEHLVDGLALLERKLVNGEDVHGHLSQSVVSAAPSRFDQMRNDYGVHHFHLGVSVSNTPPWIERTAELLFALVEDEAVYFVGVFGHGDWAKKTILGAIESSWPHLIDHSRLSAVSAAQDFSEEDIRRLRKKRVNVIHTTPAGAVVAPPGGGITSAGTSLAARRKADRFRILMREYEDLTRRDLPGLLHAAGLQSAQRGTLYFSDSEVLLKLDEAPPIAIADLRWRD